jgi:hypothetical protein
MKSVYDSMRDVARLREQEKSYEDRIKLEGPCALMGNELLVVRNSYTKKW